MITPSMIAVKTFQKILINLKHDVKTILKWFKLTLYKLTLVNFNSWFLELKQENLVKLKINSTEIEENKQVVLVGITIDNLQWEY